MIVFYYLLRHYTARVLITLLAVTVFLGLADLSELASSLVQKPDALSMAWRLYLYKLPTIFVQALPVAVLFGTLLALADLVRHGEVLALRAAGATPFRLALPPLALALVLSSFSLWVADQVAPQAMRSAILIETRQLSRWSWYWTMFHKRRNWYASEDGALYHVGEVEDEGRTLRDVIRFDFRSGRLDTLTVAGLLRHQQGQWEGTDVTAWDLHREQAESISIRPGPMRIHEGPEHFAGILGQPSELTLAQLRQAIEIRNRQGQMSLPLQIERRSRVAMPVLGVALLLLGLGFALGVRLPSGTIEAAGLGIAVSFFGWGVLAVCRALGMASILDPTLAAWLPVVVPLALGAAMLRSR